MLKANNVAQANPGGPAQLTAALPKAVGGEWCFPSRTDDHYFFSGPAPLSPVLAPVALDAFIAQVVLCGMSMAV